MAIEPKRLMQSATVASMSVALTLIDAKAVAWLLTESVRRLSSLVDPALDFVAPLLTFLAVRQALTPADAGHRFGHGKAEALDVLMDRELPDSDRDRIGAITRHDPAVRAVHDLRTRSAGLTRFIQLHIEADPDLTVVQAHEIGDQVEATIRQAFPHAEMILHVDPFGVAEQQPTFA